MVVLTFLCTFAITFTSAAQAVEVRLTVQELILIEAKSPHRRACKSQSALRDERKVKKRAFLLSIIAMWRSCRGSLAKFGNFPNAVTRYFILITEHQDGNIFLVLLSERSSALICLSTLAIILDIKTCIHE